MNYPNVPIIKPTASGKNISFSIGKRKIAQVKVFHKNGETEKIAPHDLPGSIRQINSHKALSTYLNDVSIRLKTLRPSGYSLEVHQCGPGGMMAENTSQVEVVHITDADVRAFKKFLAIARNGRAPNFQSEALFTELRQLGLDWSQEREKMLKFLKVIIRCQGTMIRMLKRFMTNQSMSEDDLNMMIDNATISREAMNTMKICLNDYSNRFERMTLHARSVCHNYKMLCVYISSARNLEGVLFSRNLSQELTSAISFISNLTQNVLSPANICIDSLIGRTQNLATTLKNVRDNMSKGASAENRFLQLLSYRTAEALIRTEPICNITEKIMQMQLNHRDSIDIPANVSVSITKQGFDNLMSRLRAEQETKNPCGVNCVCS